MSRVLAVVLVALAAAGPPAGAGETPKAQPSPPSPGTTEATVIVAPQYEAGGLHRFLLGDDYRDLWTRPVRLPVLDLATTAGGLTPVRRVGGQQTRGLALKGADGRDYTFRSLDKDPSAILPEELQGTIAGEIVRDQIAASHPAGPPAASVLLDAAGVVHTRPRIVVMPDDPRLGEFREVFKGLAGTFEEFPRGPSGDRAGFEGSLELLGYEDMWKRFQASPADRADATAFLRARLMDVLLGDWDRHRKQWRWARLPGNDRWQPIPEDRDLAFSRFEGFLLSMARRTERRFGRFGRDYPNLEGLTFNGWEQDRTILAELEWPDWERAAQDLRARLTDAVIDAAAATLPPEYAKIDAARLARGLKARRDGLPREALRYYRQLAAEVDVRATDRPERAVVTRRADRTVEVTLFDAGAPEPYFRRLLRPDETDEVRVYLEGGDDVLEVDGGPGPIRVRVLGSGGCDTVKGNARGLRVSDEDDCTTVAPGVHLDRVHYTPPAPNPRAPWVPPRDWGRHYQPLFRLGGNPDLGLFVGGALTTEGYGFRQDPFADHQRLRGGISTAHRAGRIEYEGSFRFENSPRRADVFARASGIEVVRFYGLSNESEGQGADPDEFHKVHQQQFELAPSLTIPLARRLELSFGPMVKYNTTDLDEDNFIARLRPYGSEDFGQAGARMGLVLDTRDRAKAPSRGARLSVEGRVFPALWDVADTFGTVTGEGSVYASARGPLEPTLALRVGGKQVWGRYPFHEAAFLGGGDTVRGLRSQRYAGDAAAWANAELRVRLARVFIIVPGELGVFGLTDTGRVFFDGESSDRWHTAMGGGIWLSFLKRENTLSVAVARTRERTGLYVTGGFAF